MKNTKLYFLPINIVATIKSVDYKKNVSNRLMELGFTKGSKVVILNKDKDYLIKLNNLTLTITKEILLLIEVEY